MDNTFNEKILDGEDTFKQKLIEIKGKLTHLCEVLPSLREFSFLKDLLQEVYILREGLDQLEQGLLKNFIKSSISPIIRIPQEVVLAVSKLSAKRHGAIIAIEQEDVLDDYLEGGAIIDSIVNHIILENIFFPGSPLHDGAVIIRNARVYKANCMLPVSSNSKDLERLGLASRHRAAVGISQLSDALSIVVSEEKGWISMALEGQLYPNLGTFALLQSVKGAVQEGSGTLELQMQTD